MKRREYGINLDDGVALSSEEEFRLLYVPCNPNETVYLQGWFVDDTQGPLLLGGQIGSGKTTLIKEVSRSFINAWMISVCFDTDPIEALEGGFCMLLFGRIIQACLEAGAEIDNCGIAISDFPSINVESWHALAKKMTHWPSTLQEAGRLREVCTVMGENARLVRNACGCLLNRLRDRTSREPIIIAEGIDKFRPGTSGYYSLKDTLGFLAKWKTIFEVNAVHLFQEHDFGAGLPKLFVGGIDDKMLTQILRKRLGSYSPVYQDAFSLIIDYSGGNLRQALRLLNAYYFRITQRKNDPIAAIALACHQVSKDLLNVPYGRFPIDIINVVKRDKYIEGSLLSDPKNASEASDAIYHNWLLIQKEPDSGEPTRWPTIINPLIDQAIKWEPAVPKTPEQEAVEKWAKEQGVSPIGLNLPIDDNGKPAWGRFWDEIESSIFSDRESLNILGLIEEIGAGLFGIERQDRIIITYRERKNLEAVRDFLVGEANTHLSLCCEEIILEGGKDRDPIVELLMRTANQSSECIYSIELIGNWTDNQLRDLDHRRDIFSNLQMLWWIRQDDLNRYLRFWPQLRQFFRMYRLEDELWRGITMEEIQADIDFLKVISDEPDPQGVRRLLNVLTYLKDMDKKL